MELRLSVGTPDITSQIMHSNKESSVWSIACWCHQLNTLPDKCRLNWWLNCTKKFSMNPIEILEILAIAVHSFSEMLGLGQTLLRTVQMSAGSRAGAACAGCSQTASRIARINPILTKQKKNQRKLPSAGHCIVSQWVSLGQAPAQQLSSRSVGKLGLFLCCIELAEARA